MKSSIITSALLASFVAGANAETAIDMTATLVGTSERSMAAFSESNMAGTTISTYERIDADNPLDGMTGACSGHMIVQVPEGSGSGLCTFSNDAGDSMVLTYDITGLNRDGGISGTWIVQGGTGSLMGAQGGGGFVNSADTDDGTFSQKVTGAITLP